MKDIEIGLRDTHIRPGEEIGGTVTVGYTGRYDGVVINAQILDSNELVTYTSYNGKRISQHNARLFVDRDLIPEGMIEFTARIEFEPSRAHEVKFRVSIIEQHKEIESDVLFAEFSS